MQNRLCSTSRVLRCRKKSRWRPWQCQGQGESDGLLRAWVHGYISMIVCNLAVKWSERTQQMWNRLCSRALRFKKKSKWRPWQCLGQGEKDGQGTYSPRASRYFLKTKLSSSVAFRSVWSVSFEANLLRLWQLTLEVLAASTPVSPDYVSAAYNGHKSMHDA